MQTLDASGFFMIRSADFQSVTCCAGNGPARTRAGYPRHDSPTESRRYVTAEYPTAAMSKCAFALFTSYVSAVSHLVCPATIPRSGTVS